MDNCKSCGVSPTELIKQTINYGTELAKVRKDLADAERALQVFYAGACPNCKQTMDNYFKDNIDREE